MKNIFFRFVLPLMILMNACTQTATPTATQLPSATSTQTSAPTSTLTITPTDTPTPPPTQTPVVTEQFEPTEFFFIALQDADGVRTVETNDPIIQVVDSTTAKTHLLVDHKAQDRKESCVGPTNASVIINKCFVHVLPNDVTGFKAVEGEVVDWAGTNIFFNRTKNTDPWVAYFKALPPTETVTPVPSATVYSTITLTPAPITTVADALEAMDDENVLPDTRFCSNAQDEVGVVTTQDGTAYLFSDTGCIEMYTSDAAKPFQRIAPIGKVNAPVHLKDAPWMDHPWVFEITPVNGAYGFRWHKGGIVGLGFHQVSSTNDDGYKSYWVLTPPTSTPTVTFPTTPTRTPMSTPTLILTPSKTPTPGS